jgi:hypothetical protein
MREWRSSNLSQRRSATPKRGFPVAKSRSIQPGTPQLCPEAGPVPDPSLPPSLWVATHLGFTPDPAQARFLDSRDKRLAFVGSRQSGKSETAGAKAFYLGYHHPKTDYLLFGRVARHSTILLQRIAAKETPPVLPARPPARPNERRRLSQPQQTPPPATAH